MAPARRSRSARREADDPASDNERPSRRSRRSGAGSSRRASRRGGREEASGRRRTPEGEDGTRIDDREASGRHRAGSSRRSGGAGSSRRGAGEGRDDRGRSRRGGGSTLKGRIILGICLVLGLGLLSLAVGWYPLQKTLCAREMRSAEGERVEQLVQQFLELSQANENDIRKYIVLDRDIPAATRLRVIEAAAGLEQGPALFTETVHIAKRNAKDDVPTCVRALEVAGEIYVPALHETANVPAHDLEEWATQVDRDELDRDLGEAAIRFLGKIHGSSSVDSMEILLGIINKPGRDADFVKWAVEALSGMVSETNVEKCVLALAGANAVLAATHTIEKGEWSGGTLVDAIQADMTAASLPRALELINRAEPDLQAAGFKLLTGNKIQLGTSEEDMKLRELIAVQVNLKLVPETLETSPATMLQLVQAVRKHRLTDSAEKILSLAGAMEDHADPAAKEAYKNAINALGVFFIDDATPATAEAGEQVLKLLTAAVADEALRRHVLAAAGIMTSEAKGFKGTYTLLLALVDQGGGDCIAAADRLVREVYGRPTLAEGLALDAAQWKTYMDKDRVDQLKYYEIKDWYEAHKGKLRRSDFDNDPHKTREAYAQAKAYREVVDGWVQNGTVPLALVDQQVKDLQWDMKKYVDGLRKFGLGGVDDVEIPEGGGAAGEGGQVPLRRPPLREGL